MTTRKFLAAAWRRRPRSVFAVGVTFLVITAIVLALLAFKEPITTALRSGVTIKAEFDRDYQLHAGETKVKLAGLDVGVVSAVDTSPAGTTVVSMKIDDSALDALGPKPSATIAPKTILGGQYDIDLSTGGGTGRFTGGLIPRERTHTPVELDRILEALPQPTRQSVQHVVGELGDTLATGKDPLRELVADAPATLVPAGTVLSAAQGTRPGVDLPQLVTSLDAIARVLTKQDGQLDTVVRDLHTTTAVLAQQAKPLADGIAGLPATLRTTRAGMSDLNGTLDRLSSTANSLRPAVARLDPLLQHLDPVLRQARPLLADLPPLLDDAAPAVTQLVPVVQRGNATLTPLQGPVLDRVNGPVSHLVLNTWRGSGPYADSGGGIQADHTFYQELGYLVTNLDRASMSQDAQGSFLGFQVGANANSVAGLPLTLPNLLAQLQKAAGGVQ